MRPSASPSCDCLKRLVHSRPTTFPPLLSSVLCFRFLLSRTGCSSPPTSLFAAFRSSRSLLLFSSGSFASPGSIRSFRFGSSSPVRFDPGIGYLSSLSGGMLFSPFFFLFFLLFFICGNTRRTVRHSPAGIAAFCFSPLYIYIALPCLAVFLIFLSFYLSIHFFIFPFFSFFFRFFSQSFILII